MRRIWMGSALLLALAACREPRERGDDRAFGTERRGQETQAPDGEQAMQGRQGAATPSLDTADRDKMEVARVLATIQEMNRAEIDLSKLAEQRAASPEVKQYAAKLVADHQRALDRSNLVAQQKGIDLSLVKDDPFVAAQTTSARELKDRLTRLSGPDFDSAYLSAQPEQHALFTNLAQQGERLSKDGDVDALFTELANTAHAHHASAMATIPRACGGEMTGGAPPGQQGVQPGTGQQGMQGAQPGQQDTPLGQQGGMQPGLGKGAQPQGVSPGQQGTDFDADHPGMGLGTDQGTTQPGGSGRDLDAPGGTRSGSPAGAIPGGRGAPGQPGGQQPATGTTPNTPPGSSTPR